MITRSSATDALRAAIILRQQRKAVARGWTFQTASEYAEVLSSGRYMRGVPHLELLMSVLDRAANVGGQRIIVSLPVRHGKSTSASHYFPVSYLDRWPEKNIILASYEASFARSFGRKVRNSIDEFESLLRVRIAEDSARADRWNTNEGGGMMTAGVGGPITGRGADLLIVDDPVKNWQKAQSKGDREMIWDWWTSTAYTRLEPGASVVIIMARWHQDDLCGRLLAHAASGDGDQWQEIRLPALAEANDPMGRAVGDALWPERYDEARLAKIKHTTTPQVWSSLYQQSPTPAGGSIFKREWFVNTMAMPNPADIVKQVRAWDCAATENGGDWTVGLLLAQLRDGRFVVLDVARQQLSSGGVDRLIKATALQDGPDVRVFEEREGGSSGKAVTDRREIDLQAAWVTQYRRRGTYTAVHPTGEKSTRYSGAAAQASAGNLWLLAAAPWARVLIAELAEVPNAEHDDQADALAGAYDDLTITPAPPPPRVRQVNVNGFG